MTTLRKVWSGTIGGATGFLRPDPPPPVVIGGFGPKIAELAGRIGDGLNTPAGPGVGELIGIARQAHARSGRDPASFVVTVSAAPSPRQRQRLADLGADRLIASVPAPYLEGVAQVRAALDR